MCPELYLLVNWLTKCNSKHDRVPRGQGSFGGPYWVHAGSILDHVIHIISHSLTGILTRTS